MSKSKTVMKTLNAGAGRGARLMLSAAQQFNSQSDRFWIQPTYLDAIPGRARELATDASKIGVPAKGVEGKIEDFKFEMQGDYDAVILQVDRPRAAVEGLKTAIANQRPALQYMLLRMSDGHLFGIRMVLQPQETNSVVDATRFYDRLAEVTARSGHAAILGEQGRPEHLAIEPAYRKWFSDHMQSNLPKIMSGLESDNQPIEITSDGYKTMWATVHDSGSTWSDPRTLATKVAEEPPLPVIRGDEFGVLELGPEGLRIHRAKIRKIDGKISIRGNHLLTPQAWLVHEERQKQLAQEIEKAIRQAQRQTISRRQPVFTTD